LILPATDPTLRPFKTGLCQKFAASLDRAHSWQPHSSSRYGEEKGGVGRHVTKNVPRTFKPNLHEHRIWVAELKKFVRVKTSARGLKTINKNGAYAALKKAGLIAA
jgi:large subunit ribosomal protein L28